MTKEVYSYPGIYVIGEISDPFYSGYVSIPVLQYRKVEIIDNGGSRVYNNVPDVFGKEVVDEAWKYLKKSLENRRKTSYSDELVIGRNLHDLVLLNWFYGGYIVSIINGDKYDLLDMELVNPSIKLAVIKVSHRVKLSRLDGFQWIIFGYILRKANWSMLNIFCRNNSLYCIEDGCVIPGWRNSYLAVYRYEKSLNEYISTLNDVVRVYRISVDNIGLRHVVIVD